MNVAPTLVFFFSSRRRHTRFKCDWSSDVCSSDLLAVFELELHLDRGLQRRLKRGDHPGGLRLLEAEQQGVAAVLDEGRSGERRVGEEGRSRWAPYHLKKKKPEGCRWPRIIRRTHT